MYSNAWRCDWTRVGKTRTRFSEMSKRRYTGEPGSPYKPPMKKQKQTHTQAQISKQVKKELARREIHYRDFTIEDHDVQNADNPLVALSQLYNLVPVEGSFSFVLQADGIANRTAKKISINSFRMNGSLTWPTVVEGTDTTFNVLPSVRLILAVDENCNGTVPNSAADLRMMTDNGYWSKISTNSFGKYRILKDFIVQAPLTMHSSDGTGFISSPQVKDFKVKYKFKEPLVVQFNANPANDIRQVQTNNIFMMAITNHTTSNPKINALARIAFSDF